MSGSAKGNYLIVAHTFWMYHKGWHTRMLVNVTEKEAKGEAALFAESLRKEFCHAEAKAFLSDTTQVFKT
jgi:hypothetical protein